MSNTTNGRSNGKAKSTSPRPGRRLPPRNPPNLGTGDFEQDDDNDVLPDSYAPPGKAPASPTEDDEDESPAEPGKSDKAPADEFVGSMYQTQSPGEKGGFYLPAWATLVARTKAELLVLAQFAYWFGHTRKGELRAKVQRNGYWWVYKTCSKFAAELHLTRSELRAAMRSLQEAKVLITDKDSKPGELPHYRLDPTGIQTQVEARDQDLLAGKKSRKRIKTPTNEESVSDKTGKTDQAKKLSANHQKGK